jgi:methyl-accepting chemotaxis protein
MRQARVSRAFSAVESDDTRPPSASDTDGNLRLRVVVLVPAPSRGLSLQAKRATCRSCSRSRLPGHQCRNPAAGLQRVPAALGLALGLRKIYLVTLTLTLLLAIFAAIASAFLIASDLAKPLLLLAEGTKAVAEGNLSPRPIVSTSDELGTLTQSFNTMTRQLLEARTRWKRTAPSWKTPRPTWNRCWPTCRPG